MLDIQSNDTHEMHEPMVFFAFNNTRDYCKPILVGTSGKMHCILVKSCLDLGWNFLVVNMIKVFETLKPSDLLQ